MEQLTNLRNKIDDLSLRERVAVFACVVVVMFFIWDLLLMQPLARQEKQFKTSIQQKQAEQFALNTQIADLVVQEQNDPDRKNREDLNRLRKELKEVESNVQASTQKLVTPENMAMILQTVLQQTRGLELVHVKGLGSEPVVKVTINPQAEEEEEKPAAPGSPIDNAYKHGLRIEFEGDYLTTLEYVKALEQLDWEFFWDSFEFEVIEYPRSRASINVFTLSLDEDWIGV